MVTKNPRGSRESAASHGEGGEWTGNSQRFLEELRLRRDRREQRFAAVVLLDLHAQPDFLVDPNLDYVRVETAARKEARKAAEKAAARDAST
ncbi:hypothetical protein BESB_084000 [Besnoitia besnoiti]|uniref:Uncharacterized protein n=1 Tax=Besnoitia besnoiti TaxID=94643 RepID=A0A2A9MA60_BESBE|nr:hypothetical protein BESB_084000 [Besnoitia besnoiti]PFH33201.1 hypothetical protein BESB_084000 [Besnoitia besnoiti]